MTLIVALLLLAAKVCPLLAIGAVAALLGGMGK